MASEIQIGVDGGECEHVEEQPQLSGSVKKLEGRKKGEAFF